MQMISVIEQHIGNDPDTGLRMIQYHEVITEMAVGVAARIGDLHAVEVELAMLDAEPRAKAEAWLVERADQIDSSNKADWIKLAIEAFMACARCRVQAYGDNVTLMINHGWRRVNPHDVTAGMGLRWVCAACWQLLVRKDVCSTAFRASIREDLLGVIAEISTMQEPDVSEEYIVLAEAVCSSSQEEQTPEMLHTWAAELSAVIMSV